MKTEYQNSIIRKLRKLREDEGVSQFGVATILGISPGQVGNIESTNTSHKYTLKQIYTLCSEFGVPIEQIFIEDNEYHNKEVINLLISKIIQYGEK